MKIRKLPAIGILVSFLGSNIPLPSAYAFSGPSPALATLSSRLTNDTSKQILEVAESQNIYAPSGTKVSFQKWKMAQGELEKLNDAALESMLNFHQAPDLKIAYKRFPDGEFYVRAMNPRLIKDRSFQMEIDIQDPQSIPLSMLALDILQKNDAGSVDLIFSGWSSLKNEEEKVQLLDMHHSMASDKLKPLIFSRSPEGKLTQLNFTPIEIKKDPNYGKSKIRKVIYLDPSLEKLATGFARRLYGADVASLDSDLKGENVAVVHTMATPEQINDLLLALPKLRTKGVRSITLFSSYLAYARQDQDFGNQGASVSIEALVRYLDHYVDKIAAVSIHNAPKTGDYDIGGVKVLNLNGFTQLAQYKLNELIKGMLRRQRLTLSSRPSAIRKVILSEFEKHPLMLIAPDKGASVAAYETRDVLKEHLHDRFGIPKNKIRIHVAFLKKTREGDRKTVFEPELYRYKDSRPPVKVDKNSDENIVEFRRFNRNSWVFLLDDEVASGSTTLGAVYSLVFGIGFNWQKILASVVHGKFSDGLKKFSESVPPHQLYFNKLPVVEPDSVNKHMAPKFITSSESYPIDKKLAKQVSIKPLMNVQLSRLFRYALRSGGFQTYPEQLKELAILQSA